MHGMHVHEAVAAAGETETGITVHYVNEHYDEGDIIAQFAAAVAPGSTALDIAHIIADLEARHFAAVVEEVITNG
jgi:phosphoribosylglycinamide formyltransferase-1